VALRFADRYNSAIHLVRVVTVPVYGDISDMGYPNLIQVMEEAAEHYLGTVADRPGMPAERHRQVLPGSPATALETYVKEHHIDLVVMTSHGRGGLGRVAFGSVTDRLLGAAAPVLVVKPAGLAAVHHES
jgi:nucleotide-binding universal stress UspA family protein